jgi:hypothetical protein
MPTSVRTTLSSVAFILFIIAWIAFLNAVGYVWGVLIFLITNPLIGALFVGITALCGMGGQKLAISINKKVDDDWDGIERRDFYNNLYNKKGVLTYNSYGMRVDGTVERVYNYSAIGGLVGMLISLVIMVIPLFTWNNCVNAYSASKCTWVLDIFPWITYWPWK